MRECQPLEYGEISSKDYLPGAEMLKEDKEEPEDQGKFPAMVPMRGDRWEQLYCRNNFRISHLNNSQVSFRLVHPSREAILQEGHGYARKSTNENNQNYIKTEGY